MHMSSLTEGGGENSWPCLWCAGAAIMCNFSNFIFSNYHVVNLKLAMVGAFTP